MLSSNIACNQVLSILKSAKTTILISRYLCTDKQIVMICRCCFEGSDNGNSINTCYETEDPILANLSFSQLASLVLTKVPYKAAPQNWIIPSQFWRETFLVSLHHIIFHCIEEIYAIVLRHAKFSQSKQSTKHPQRILMWSLFLGTFDSRYWCVFLGVEAVVL